MSKKNIIIIAIVLIIIITVLMFIFKKGEPLNEIISKELIKNEFVKDDEIMYSKGDDLSLCDIYTSFNDCSSKRYFFSLGSYNYYLKKVEVVDNVGFDFIHNDDFKLGESTYTYRINYRNGVIYIDGKYDMNNKTYTCNLNYQYGINSNNIDNYCSSLKEDLDSFYYSIKTLFKDVNLIKKMKEDK